MSGMARRTRPDRRRLVTSIMAMAPASISELRSAIEAAELNNVLICSVSAVSRDMTSPVMAVS